MEILVTNPMFYIGALFAFFAVIGFLIYLRGFISSIGDVFTLAGHDEHVRHGHVRVAHGLLIITTVFIVWQVIRAIVGWLSTL